MKHTRKITFILIAMFIITQLIGLAVIYAYTPNIEQVEINGEIVNVTTNPLPYNLEPPENNEPISVIPSTILAFVIAIILIFLLSKYKFAKIIRLWFFTVICLVLAITFYAIEILIPLTIDPTVALIIPLLFSIPLAYLKVFKHNVIVHNLTELMIYPGIAVVFVSVFSGLKGIWPILSIILILILISIYDMWAVWHSGFMQKMAKFQMEELKIFGGFLIPYMDRKQRQQVKQAKLKIKKGEKVKTKNMKINLAILGGGDVVFPIITAGIVLRTMGLLPALFIIAGATIALYLLFAYSKKGKFYPAMPFITAGLLAGIAAAYLI